MFNCPICGYLVDCTIIFKLLEAETLATAKVRYQIKCSLCQQQILDEDTLKLDEFMQLWGNHQNLVFSVTAGDGERWELWNWDASHFDGRVFGKDGKEAGTFLTRPFNEICEEMTERAANKIRRDREALPCKNWLEITGFYRR